MFLFISEPTSILIILLLLLASGFLAYKNLKYAFYFVLFLVPLMHKEVFSLFQWDLLPVRVAIIGVAIVAFVTTLLRFWNYDSEKRIAKLKNFARNDPFLVLLIMLWIIRLISIYKTEDLNASLGLMAFFTLVLVTYFIFKWLLFTYKNDFFHGIISIYLTLAYLTGIFAIYQFYMRLCCRYSIGGVWVVPGYTPRLGSTFWDVNHYGGFLITILPIAFALVFINKKLVNKFVVGTLSIFLAWLLFMSQSRSAWIGLLAGLSLSFSMFYWNRLKKPIIISIACVLLALGGLLTYTTVRDISIRDKIGRFMHSRLDSTDTHVMLIEGAVEVFFNHLLLGTGYGSFDSAFRETETAKDYFDREPKLRDSKVPPHSVWGEALGETGGAGFIIYVSFAILLIGSIIYSIFTTNQYDLKYLGIGILGSVTSIFVSGLFYSYNMEFYWITIFLGIGYVFLASNYAFSITHVISWWYSKRISPYLILVPISVFLVFLKLGSTTLIDWDEAIYAKIARNILESHNWLSLRWDSDSKFWFEKPPLYMWMTALVFKITNFNSFGARFISACFGILGIFLTYQFGTKLYNKLTGVIAGLILLSTVHYLYYSRNGMFDVTVSFFITASIYCIYLAINSAKKERIFAILAGTALGLGIMTKAVIGLLPIPIIVIYLLFLRIFYKKPFPILVFLYFIVAAIAVAGPWHLYSYIIHGDRFIKNYFFEHMLSRGFSGLGHEQSFWWFLEVIKVSFRIWVVPFGIGLAFLPFYDRKKIKEFFLLVFTIAFVLIFFSVSKDKLLWYIVPIYPFMAVLTARSIERLLVWVNSLIRNDIRPQYFVTRTVGVLLVIIISLFHVIIMRDRIYYPDFNKDKVAMVKIFNEMYPVEDHPSKKLYYNNIAPSVLLFYSNHQIESVTHDSMLRHIDNASPDESKTFLIPDTLFYEIKDEQAEISAPLVLDIKGSAGGWILVKSVSRVDVLKSEFATLIAEIMILEDKDFRKVILPDERIRLKVANARLAEVVSKLNDYGYPPYN